MDKKELLVSVGLELGKSLFGALLSFLRTSGIPQEKIDEAFEAAKAEFLACDPSNIKLED